jgi:S1-C subfamily serine protease
MPLGDAEALKIGDSLWVAGFPEIGGTASRPSVTVTRGIVAGFEWQRNGTLVKTDAQLHAGTSGGAALNDRFELVGVPSETMEEINGSGVGQLGYVRPLSLVPPAWRKLIDERRNKK